VSALVFMDTETTGLSLDDDIWEFAAIRRDQDGTETELHLFIEHDAKKCARLPEQFNADHAARFPSSCSGRSVSRARAASEIAHITREKAHIVGAVPNFDTERIAQMLLTECNIKQPPWHYHLIDVENLAVGYLAAEEPGCTDPDGKRLIVPPFDSDMLSFAVGVNADNFERHTAMGDVRWAMAIYDAITGRAS